MVLVTNAKNFENSLKLQLSSRSNAIIQNVDVEAEFVWDCKNILRLITLLFVNFCVATCFSLPAPFFPREAELKGATPTVYGLIFGVFQLVLFVCSPLWGKLMNYSGPKFTLVTGIAISSICSIFFGLLDWCPAGNAFISLAFLVRIVEAVGVSATYSAGYGLVPILFRSKIGFVIAAMESAFGAGNIIGPTIGGFLFQAGGFPLPFIVMGSFMFSAIFATFLAIPSTVEKNECATRSVLEMLLNGTFLMDLTIMALCFTCIGFNEATLEPHLRQFNLKPYILGLVFIIQGIAYAISSPLWGCVMDKGFDGQVIGLVGCLLTLISYLLVGPAPFFPFGTYLNVVILSQVILGLGLGAQLLCSYIHAMKNVLSRGFPDNVATHTLYSGVMVSVSAVGSFIGPSVGGALLEHFGYPNATMFIVAIHCLAIVALAVFLIYSKRHSSRNGERTALSYQTTYNSL